MTEKLNASGSLLCKLVYKITTKTNKEITDIVKEANYDDNCLDIITWCHTLLSYDVTAEQMKDWTNMMDIEFVHITNNATVEFLESLNNKR